MTVARRPRPRVTTDLCIGRLQRIDKAEGDIARPLVEVVGDDFLNILLRYCAQDDALGFHALVRRLVPLRTRSRSPSK